MTLRGRSIEHIYGVSLRGQKFVKLALGGEVVLEISHDAIPREYWAPNRFSTELGVLLSGMDVAPNGDLNVTESCRAPVARREFLGVVNDDPLLPAALTIDGNYVIVGERNDEIHLRVIIAASSVVERYD